MDENKIIASAISDNELAQAFSELVAQRWDNWDLTPFLPYLVDTVAATVLPYLAEQFDVEGLRGFAIAIDEEQQRDIIKKSIALHKFIGTPWAIREACRTVGFPVIILEESVTEIPCGPESPEDWARFRVLVAADVARHISEDDSRKLRLFVEFYKNQRSHLVELGYYQPLAERLAMHEGLDITFLSLSPNPVILAANGSGQIVTVNSNVAWLFEKSTYNWSDGSGDILTVKYSGKAGNSEITITSDYYIKKNPSVRAYSAAYSAAYSLPGSDERVIRIPVYSTIGNELGALTVIQRPGFNNAYGRAYSNAYNVYDHRPFITVTPSEIWLPDDPEQSTQITIESNTHWTIE